MSVNQNKLRPEHAVEYDLDTDYTQNADPLLP